MRTRLLLLTALVVALGGFAAAWAQAPKPAEPQKGHAHVTQTAEITMEKGGVIKIEFFADDAPKTVENFVTLAKKGFYNGLTFHRIEPNFVIQGGDPKGNGTGGPGWRFKDEFQSNLRHDKPGRLSMANAGANTNGSQFFLTEVPTPWLDGKHTIFGEVIENLPLIARIGRAGNGEVALMKVSIFRA